MAVPIAFAVAKPIAFTVAMVMSEDDQLVLASAVTSTWLPSVKIAVAVNCRVAPANRLTFVGATSRVTGIGGPTFSVVFPLTLPDAAVIVAGPGDTVLARPNVEIVTIDDGEALQMTALVTSDVLPPLKLPVVPCGMMLLLAEFAMRRVELTVPPAMPLIRVSPA